MQEKPTEFVCKLYVLNDLVAEGILPRKNSACLKTSLTIYTT